MKVKIIKTYDMGKFSQLVEEMYEKYDVDHVDTHTEHTVINREITYFIAIVFYKDKETSHE
jgi:hypothetical protein